MNRFVATACVFVACAIPALAQDSDAPRRRIGFGPEVGIFIPVNERTRAAFGETWVNYGIGVRPIQYTTSRGTTGFDLNIISTRGSGRRATLIPLSGIYKRAIGGGQPGVGVIPYVGATGGLLIADLRSDNYGVSSGFRTGYGASVLTGITYQTSAYVEARYQGFNKIKGFDLSGISLSAGYRF